MSAIPHEQAAPGGLKGLVESERFQRFILGLIILNAITLGVDTLPGAQAAMGGFLEMVDHVVVTVFAIELALRLVAYRASFFKSGWNWFDLLVVCASLVPAAGAFSVLRLVRVIRLARLISMIPAMRVVVESLLHALPGIASVGMLLGLIMYVSAVLCVKLFGQVVPELFGHMGVALFSLLAVMTMDGWPEVAKPVMKFYPWAWVFFIGYLVMTTFTVMNLFVGVVVSGMEDRIAAQKEVRQRELEEELARQEAEKGELDSVLPLPSDPALLAEVKSLRAEMAELRSALRARNQAGL
jgi:voltage-gated sodium channel